MVRGGVGGAEGCDGRGGGCILVDNNGAGLEGGVGCAVYPEGVGVGGDVGELVRRSGGTRSEKHCPGVSGGAECRRDGAGTGGEFVVARLEAEIASMPGAVSSEAIQGNGAGGGCGGDGYVCGTGDGICAIEGCDGNDVIYPRDSEGGEGGGLDPEGNLHGGGGGWDTGYRQFSYPRCGRGVGPGYGCVAGGGHGGCCEAGCRGGGGSGGGYRGGFGTCVPKGVDGGYGYGVLGPGGQVG